MGMFFDNPSACTMLALVWHGGWSVLAFYENDSHHFLRRCGSPCGAPQAVRPPVRWAMLAARGRKKVTGNVMRTLKQNEESTLRQTIASAIEETGLQMIAVYLHGSYGTEYMRNDSDIDFAFLAERTLDFKESMAFSVALQKAFHDGELDTADLRRSNTVFQAQVVTSGERVYTGDELAAQRFEMTTLSKYARLNEERESIIADIKQSGRVYRSDVRPT